MRFNKRKKIIDEAFNIFGLLISLMGLIILGIFLYQIADKGLSRVDWKFISSLPSRFPENAGIYTALMGTIWLMTLTAFIAIPIGLMAAIYLEEYSKQTQFGKILEINISNLAGVPSIIYGILGLELFARSMNLGNSILTGSLTLALLILPIIVVSTREALRAIPLSLKEGSFALSASKWQTIYRLILPAAAGNIMTGVILSLSRAIGEAAPLIVAGALVYVPFAPSSPMDSYSVLPIQIFNWVSRPQEAFAKNAAAGIIVLLFVTLTLNGIAILYRNHFQKKNRW